LYLSFFKKLNGKYIITNKYATCKMFGEFWGKGTKRKKQHLFIYNAQEKKKTKNRA